MSRADEIRRELVRIGTKRRLLFNFSSSEESTRQYNMLGDDARRLLRELQEINAEASRET